MIVVLSSLRKKGLSGYVVRTVISVTRCVERCLHVDAQKGTETDLGKSKEILLEEIKSKVKTEDE